MMPKIPLMIVFTDELGSTKRDCELLSDLNNKRIKVSEYKKAIATSRVNLFNNQIKRLGDYGGKWTVIKTVGDALIISLNATASKDLKNIADSCLGALFNIWEHSKATGKIRVACHLTDSDEIILGIDYPELKRCFKGKKGGKAYLDLKPVSKSIQADMFGPAMNMCARLASIPKASLFVVSRELMDFLFPKESISQRIADNESSDLSFKIESDTVKVRAYPVPIVNIKGFEPPDNTLSPANLSKFSIAREDGDKLKGYMFPRYTWEIEVPDFNITYIDDTQLPLRIQLKEMQSLKLVVGKFGSSSQRTRNNAMDFFEKNRLKVNPCKLFVDCVFKVKNTYSLFPQSLFRDFNGSHSKVEWENADIKNEGNKNNSLDFLYVMLTSVPDLRTNWLLRKYFTPKNISKGWNIQHISLDVYESTIFPQKNGEDIKKEILDVSFYYLLLFQIKDEYANNADNWKLFFNSDNNKLIDSADAECGLAAYGLLRGEFDGFVLYSASTDSLDALKKEILSSLRLTHSFFYKIAPILLFDLSRFDINLDNIKYLQIQRSRHDQIGS